LSGDVFEGLPADVADADPAVAITPARSSSQGSLHSLDDLNDKENNLRGKEARQDNKNRLSFKLVKQQMKVSARAIWKRFVENV
jgi:hypothetical protein